MKVRQIIPDWLKGIGIILMVHGHIIPIGSFVEVQNQSARLMHTFHMPLFLIVSGFFFKLENEPYKIGKDLIERLVRPYAIFGSLYIIGVLLIQKAGISTTTIPPSSFIDFIKILFLYPRGPYWFLHSLILIRLCFILGVMIATRLKLDKSVSLTITLFLVATSCSFNMLTPNTFVYFFLGIILQRFGGLLPMSGKTGFLIVAIVLIFFRSEIFSLSTVQVAWCLAIIDFLAGVGRVAKKNLIVSIVAWIGNNSLIVLVVHPIFTTILKTTSSTLLIIDATGAIYSLIVSIVAILGSIFMAFLFDKFKYSIYLFGVENIYSSYVKA